MITSIIYPTNLTYPTYRAVDRPLYFKGLTGPYIPLAAVALIGDLLLFVILYICRTPPWLCVLIALTLGAASLITARRLSRRFGAHGLEHYLNARSRPRTIRFDRQTNCEFLKHQFYGEEK